MADPFFIVGNSRSGTTLISRILKNNPEIHVLNETHFFEEFASQIQSFEELNRYQLFQLVNSMITIQRKDYYRKSKYEEYPSEAVEILESYRRGGKRRFSALNQAVFNYEAIRLGKKRAGDQTPRHVFYVDEIFSMYPEAKVINMIRDPRAVLFSQKKKWKSGLRRKQPLFEVTRTLLNYHPVTTSFLWCKSVLAGLKAESRYGGRNVLSIKFEDLMEAPESVVEKICKFLDEAFHHEMLDVTVELSANSEQEGQRGVSREIARQWQNGMSSAEIYLCERITGKLMSQIGYRLSGIKPNWPLIGLYAFWMPFHLGISFLMNLDRMGNPLKYISKRLFWQS